MNKFEKFTRVRIIKPRPDLRLRYPKCRDLEAWVIEFDDDGNPIVEYSFQFNKHIAVFKEEELEEYEQEETV